jgi:hypothetical protein
MCLFIYHIFKGSDLVFMVSDFTAVIRILKVRLGAYADPTQNSLRAHNYHSRLTNTGRIGKAIPKKCSASTVYKLNSDELDRSVHGPLIEKLKREIRSIGDYVVKWARRSANAIAHTLAKEGSGLEYSRTWFIVFPDCIKGMLARDLLSV